MIKLTSIFLEKLRVLKESDYLKKDDKQAESMYSSYSRQYLNASDEQKKWMDKKVDYILKKIKTLEKKVDKY